jgi:hypothetical protein
LLRLLLLRETFFEKEMSSCLPLSNFWNEQCIAAVRMETASTIMSVDLSLGGD